MKRTRLPRDSGVEAEINLTSLIDVVFVVLIIFIVIAPMLDLDRVELANAAPSNERTNVKEASSLTIHVKQDNTIWFGTRCVSPEQLTQILKQSYTAGRIPQLFQDKRAAFGTYQTVKNAIEVAGYEQMDVILKPSND